jgi:hypothetical protein
MAKTKKTSAKKSVEKYVAATHPDTPLVNEVIFSPRVEVRVHRYRLVVNNDGRYLMDTSTAEVDSIAPLPMLQSAMLIAPNHERGGMRRPIRTVLDQGLRGHSRKLLSSMRDIAPQKTERLSGEAKGKVESLMSKFDSQKRFFFGLAFWLNYDEMTHKKKMRGKS